MLPEKLRFSSTLDPSAGDETGPVRGLYVYDFAIARFVRAVDVGHVADFQGGEAS